MEMNRVFYLVLKIMGLEFIKIVKWMNVFNFAMKMDL